MEAGKKEPVLCQICEENPSKYLCPRCGAPYCSLLCYKNEEKHLQCSEAFYKDCVTEHVRNEEVRNPENAKKMQEILNKFNREYNENEGQAELDFVEEMDSDDDEPLESRLEGINLDDSEEVWKHLTEDERKEFENLAKNYEEAGEVIPEWVPWWYDPVEKKLVEEVSEDESKARNKSDLILHQRQPDIMKDIPKLADLTKLKPNEQVAKGLVNVIASFVWVSRIYNGDVFDEEKLVEIASAMICLSSYLNNNSLFNNVEHAVADVPMNACKVPALSEGGTTIHAGLSRDVWTVVKGPEKVPLFKAKGYILSALTECYLILSKAIKQTKNGMKPAAKQPLPKAFPANKFASLFPTPQPIVCADVKLMTNSKRKILYLIAFANEFIESYRQVLYT